MIISILAKLLYNFGVLTFCNKFIISHNSTWEDLRERKRETERDTDTEIQRERDRETEGLIEGKRKKREQERWGVLSKESTKFPKLMLYY